MTLARSRGALLALLLCLGLRLIFFALVQPWHSESEARVLGVDDTEGNHALASTLLSVHRFAYSSGGDPEPLRTPLYPLFIAGIYALVGSVPWLVMLVQILVDTLSCLLLLLAVARLVNHRVALVSALFYALDPFLIMYASTLMSETLLVFMLVGALYWLSLALTALPGRSPLPFYLASGAFLGLATLVKPAPQYASLLLVGLILARHRHQLLTAARYSLLSLVVFVLVLSPWIVRNYRVFGSPSLSSSGPHNLLSLHCVPVEMARRQQDLTTTGAALLAEADRLMLADGWKPEELTPFRRGDYYRQLAIRCITSDPLLSAQVYARGALLTVGGLGTSLFTTMLGLQGTGADMSPGVLPGRDARVLLFAGLASLYLVVTYLAAFVGLATAWRRMDAAFLAFSIAMVVYFIGIAGPIGVARYKLPATPFYLPLVGLGVAYLYERSHPSRDREGARASAPSRSRLG